MDLIPLIGALGVGGLLGGILARCWAGAIRVFGRRSAAPPSRATTEPVRSVEG